MYSQNAALLVQDASNRSTAISDRKLNVGGSFKNQFIANGEENVAGVINVYGKDAKAMQQNASLDYRPRRVIPMMTFYIPNTGPAQFYQPQQQLQAPVTKAFLQQQQYQTGSGGRFNPKLYGQQIQVRSSWLVVRVAN